MRAQFPKISQSHNLIILTNLTEKGPMVLRSFFALSQDRREVQKTWEKFRSCGAFAKHYNAQK